MAEVTYFVALPFLAADDGVAAGEPIECFNPGAAVTRADLRAGFALKVMASPVNGLVPLRALVAGFLMTTNLAKPGTTNAPFFFSSLCSRSRPASPSRP